MDGKSVIIKKPCNVIEIDENATRVVWKRGRSSPPLPCTYEETGKLYNIKTTTSGIQMTGA